MNTTKRRIYLSGGMSGVERAEYVRRFGEAERILRRHGYGVINPCRVWACRWPWIYRAMEWAMGKRLAYAVVLCYDLLLLMTVRTASRCCRAGKRRAAHRLRTTSRSTSGCKVSPRL